MDKMETEPTISEEEKSNDYQHDIVIASIRVANNTDKLVTLAEQHASMTEQILNHISNLATAIQSLHHINERLIMENVNLRKKVQGAPLPSATSGDDFSPYGNEPRPPRPIVFGDDGPDGQIRLTGGTFDFKHIIKQHDGRWDSAAKVWTIPTASREATTEALKTAGALI